MSGTAMELGRLLLMLTYFQVECSPMCKIEWLIGEDLVLPDNVEYMIEEEEVEEDKDNNHFSSVTSTLVWLQLDKTINNFSATCRSMNLNNSPK